MRLSTLQRKVCAQGSGGSAERVGFLSQRVLTEVQVGFRPHVILDLRPGKLTARLTLTRRFFAAMRRTYLIVAGAWKFLSATKPDGENTEYKLDLGIEVLPWGHKLQG